MAAAVGLPQRLMRRRRRRRDYRVFILEYHGVTRAENPSEGLVTRGSFSRHLRHLATSYSIVTVAAAVRRLTSSEPLTEDLLVLTFDDGYADNAELAWPLIEGHGATATIFVTTGFLDGEPLWFDVALRGLRALKRSREETTSSLAEALRRSIPGWHRHLGAFETVGRLMYVDARERERLVGLLAEVANSQEGLSRPLSWEQARAISRAGGEIGAHTVSHPILSRLDPTAQEGEIRGSRDRVAKELGIEPSSFAYPNGTCLDFDATTREIVARVGFEAACTTVRGSNAPGCDPLRLRRLGVGEDSIAALDARLAGLFDERVRRPIAELT
jgi:peptidoglycan/xylan/chitin deacetylase (PgdA/CDA1 family)